MQFKNLLVVSSGLIASAISAVSFAAVDVGVTTALTDAKTDVATIGGLVLIVLVAAAAFKYMRRAM
jgi:hypothetical protein